MKLLQLTKEDALCAYAPGNDPPHHSHPARLNAHPVPGWISCGWGPHRKGTAHAHGLAHRRSVCGYGPFHTPQELVDASVRFFEERGYSLGVDWPYEGTIVPLAWHGKDKRVASIMLEVNRKLYLEDGSSDKNGDYDLVRQIIQDYLDVIASNMTS